MVRMFSVGQQNIGGVCATIGGILIHLTLGNLYSFGMDLKASWFKYLPVFIFNNHDTSVFPP